MAVISAASSLLLLLPSNLLSLVLSAKPFVNQLLIPSIVPFLHLSVILTLILFHSFGTGVRTEKKDPQYTGAGTYETKTAVSINSLYSNWFFVY